jgi:hypothetical protein
MECAQPDIAWSVNGGTASKERDCHSTMSYKGVWATIEQTGGRVGDGRRLNYWRRQCEQCDCHQRGGESQQFT